MNDNVVSIDVISMKENVQEIQKQLDNLESIFEDTYLAYKKIPSDIVSGIDDFIDWYMDYFKFINQVYVADKKSILKYLEKVINDWSGM